MAEKVWVLSCTPEIQQGGLESTCSETGYHKAECKIMRIAFVGNFSQPHCSEVHWAATFEDLGHSVTRIQENQIVGDSLLQLVAGHDLFFWVRTWPGFVTHDHLRKVRELGIMSVNYHLDLFVGLQRQDGLDNDPRWRCDYVFTPDGDPASQAIFESKGINHHYIRPGVFKPECEFGNMRPELVNDVTFVGGGVDYGHFREWPYRRQLVTWLKNTYGPRYSKYGHPEPTMRNQDLNDLYASAKVVVGDSLCPGFNKPGYWSDRTYECIGRGGFLIMPYIKGLEEEFTDGETIVFYEFGNFPQLKEKIDYYIEHDEERELIRRAGQEFVKNNATYHNRLQQMLDIVLPKTHGYSIPYDPAKQANIDEKNKAAEAAKNQGTLKINLGAGAEPKDGFVNVDHLDLPGIDIVHNLVMLPYPFADNSAELVHAIDVLEHLPNYTPDWKPMIVAFIDEMYRILKLGGELYIQTPGFRAEFAFQDPTHVRPFHPKTFDLWDPETDYGKTNGYYSKSRFKVSCEELDNGNLRVYMVKQ